MIARLLSAILTQVSLILAIASPSHASALQDSSPTEAREFELTDEDWRAVRATHRRARHTVESSEHGYRAFNDGQAWSMELDQRGFLVEPRAGDWAWGLELRTCGFAGYDSR